MPLQTNFKNLEGTFLRYKPKTLAFGSKMGLLKVNISKRAWETCTQNSAIFFSPKLITNGLFLEHAGFSQNGCIIRI